MCPKSRGTVLFCRRNRASFRAVTELNFVEIVVAFFLATEAAHDAAGEAPWAVLVGE